MIAEGRVEVNGERVEHAGIRIDPVSDTVCVDDRPVRLPRRNTSLILNKPRGMLVTLKDPRGRSTIAAILADLPERVFPVGRLDKDSGGLLLLTSDGDLAHRVAHPSFGFRKTYRVTVAGEFNQADLSSMRRGVLLTEGMTRPVSARILGGDSDRTEIEIVLVEGRKREIRRILSRLGFGVTSLVRVGLGELRLGALRPGEWRLLSSQEVRELRRAAGLEDRD